MFPSLIASLRGLTPSEVPAIAAALIESGVTMLELPLDGPDALDCISLIARDHAATAQISAGNALTPAQVIAAADAGAHAVMSPNTNPAVIGETRRLGLASYPGVATPTECFTAIESGATGLRLFPANLIGPKGLIAYRAVLPPDMPVLVAGGVSPRDLGSWLRAGALGIAIDNAPYRPGDTADSVRLHARILVAALDNQM